MAVKSTESDLTGGDNTYSQDLSLSTRVPITTPCTNL